MANKVFLKDDIVEIHVVGDQTAESVFAMGEEAKLLLEELKKHNKPLLVLDDITKMGQTDTNARKAVADTAKQMGFDRAVMLGNGMLMRYGTNLMLQAIGKGDQLHYFEDRDEALAWLRTQV